MKPSGVSVKPRASSKNDLLIWKLKTSLNYFIIATSCLPHLSSIGIAIITTQNICWFQCWIARILISQIFISKVIDSKRRPFNATCWCLFKLSDIAPRTLITWTCPDGLVRAGNIRNSPEYIETKIKMLSFRCLDLTKRFYECEEKIQKVKFEIFKWQLKDGFTDLNGMTLIQSDYGFQIRISFHRINFEITADCIQILHRLRRVSNLMLT